MGEGGGKLSHYGHVIHTTGCAGSPEEGPGISQVQFQETETFPDILIQKALSIGN